MIRRSPASSESSKPSSSSRSARLSSKAEQPFTMPRPCTPPDSDEIERHLEQLRDHGAKKTLRQAKQAITGVFRPKRQPTTSTSGAATPRPNPPLRKPSDPAVLAGNEPDSPHLSPFRKAIPGSDAVTPMALATETTTSPYGSEDVALKVSTPPAEEIREVLREASMAITAQGGPWIIRRAAVSEARRALTHEVRLGTPKLVAGAAAIVMPKKYLEDQFFSQYATWTPDDVRAACDNAKELAKQNQLPAPDTDHIESWLANFDEQPNYVQNRIQAAETLAAHGKIARLDDVIAQANRYANERGEAPITHDKVQALFKTCAKRLAEKARAASKFGDDKNMVSYLEKQALCYTRLGEPAPNTDALRKAGKAKAARRQIDLAFVAAGQLDPKFKKAGNQARRRLVRAAASAGAKLYGVGPGRRALVRLIPSTQLTRMVRAYIDRYSTPAAIEQALAHADAAQLEGRAKLPDTTALRTWLRKS